MVEAVVAAAAAPVAVAVAAAAELAELVGAIAFEPMVELVAVEPDYSAVDSDSDQLLEQFPEQLSVSEWQPPNPVPKHYLPLPS